MPVPVDLGTPETEVTRGGWPRHNVVVLVDVHEVLAGYECGIGLENCQDIHPGDVIEAFEQVQVLRRLESQGQRAEARLSA